MPNHRPRRRGPRAALALLGAFLLLSLAAMPVSAHVALASSGPADGETVQGSPTDVVVRFTEDLVPDRSFFNLKNAAGTILGRGAPDPANPRALVLAPPELVPGEYRVEWQAVGTDGHVERGSFSFVVAPPASTPPPAATPTLQPSPEPAPTSAPSADPFPSPASTATPSPVPGEETPAVSTTDVLFPILAGLALLGGLGLFLARRTRAG